MAAHGRKARGKGEPFKGGGIRSFNHLLASSGTFFLNELRLALLIPAETSVGAMWAFFLS